MWLKVITLFRLLNKFDDQRSTEKIFTRTNPVVAFLSCSYRGFDCRKKWKKVLTKYGLCQQLHPNALLQEKVSSNLILAITVGELLFNRLFKDFKIAFVSKSILKGVRFVNFFCQRFFKLH